jgi:enoyl-CoA hydratase/carnithine racemase
VIILRGAGQEAFAAGADISEFGENRQSGAMAKQYEQRNQEALAAIRNSVKPTLAMIHGFCIGGGLAIALACDIRLAAQGASFALPPAKLGLAYPFEGLRQVLAIIGVQRR